jgi:hypothetical protein
VAVLGEVIEEGRPDFVDATEGVSGHGFSNSGKGAAAARQGIAGGRFYPAIDALSRRRFGLEVSAFRRTPGERARN